MGRGDRRTKKGKIASGSFGNIRPQKVEVLVAPKAEKASKATAKKK